MYSYITEYNDKILAGEIIVGKWIKKLYKIVTARLDSKEYYFDEKKAVKSIKFIENFVHHSKGRADLLKLELWQRALVSLIFGVVDDEGRRIFQEVFVVVSRKNGKSLLATAIAECVAFMDGEYGGEIYCIAPKLEQAGIVYDGIYQSIQAEPELKELVKKRRADVYIEESNTVMRPLAFSAKKSDGFNPSCVIADEIASWQGDAGLKQYEVLKSAFGARRQPLMVSISTAGYINDGIYDELMKRSTAFLNGDSRELHLLPVLYIIDDVEKWQDINELEKSNPNLRVSVTAEFLQSEAIIAESSMSKRAEFLTKYCNIKQNSSQAWLDTVDVEKSRAAIQIDDFRDCYAVAGIDLSQTTDLTCCCVIIEKAGVLYIFSKFFMPASKLDELTSRDGVPYAKYVSEGSLILSGDNYVDYNDCYQWYLDLMQNKGLYMLKVGYDRYSSQYLIKDLTTAGFQCDDVYQGENLTGVIREFEGIFKDGNIKIDNDLMAVHFLNGALKLNAETRRVRLVKIRAQDHIDGLAAVLDAMTVRQKYSSEIAYLLKNEE